MHISNPVRSKYLCEGWKIIYLVLFGLSDRRFAQNHWNKSFIAILARLYKFLIFGSLKYMEVSSAKDKI